MNYYPFHIGDYASATRHLSWAEDMAFRRLLDVYYTTEKPLPVEVRAVCRLVLATTDEQREAVQIVLQEFFALTDDGWANARADAELAVMRDKQQKQRDKANKRWDKVKTDAGNAAAGNPAMPQHGDCDATASKGDANAMPPTPTPTPTPTPDIKKVSSKPSALRPDEIPEQLWSDFVQLRKAKKAALTESALEGLRAEGAKHGYTLQAVLVHCCEKGHAGFYPPKEGYGARASPSLNRQEALEARNRQASEAWLRQSEPVEVVQ